MCKIFKFRSFSGLTPSISLQIHLSALILIAISKVILSYEQVADYFPFNDVSECFRPQKHKEGGIVDDIGKRQRKGKNSDRRFFVYSSTVPHRRYWIRPTCPTDSIHNGKSISDRQRVRRFCLFEEEIYNLIETGSQWFSRLTTGGNRLIRYYLKDATNDADGSFAALKSGGSPNGKANDLTGPT